MGHTEEELNKIVEAADKGDSDAQLKLGMLFIRSDEKKALKWIYRSAKQGNIEAITELGILYEDGKCGLEQSNEKAVGLYLRAAKSGHVPAIKLINSIVESGKIAGESFSNILQYYLSAGREDARFYIGQCYEKGIGTEADINEAMKYYKQLVAEKDEKTYEHLILYYFERGNTKTLLKLCNYASIFFNNEHANRILGDAFCYGSKDFKDEKKAVEFFSRTKKARADLARCYYMGKGVDPDITKAMSLYEELINEGDQSAKYPYRILSRLQGRSILSIRDISEIDISEIDESVVGAIQIVPDKNEDGDAHTLYSIDDYISCVDVINNEILNDIEPNTKDNEFEIFMKICTKLASHIMYDEALEQNEKSGNKDEDTYKNRNIINRIV